MKKWSLLLLAILTFTGAVAAQDFPGEPYEFLVAKLAAEEGRYEEALERFDRIIERTPGNPTLLYERAMVLIDAGRIEKAESDLRAVAAQAPDFYDANRVLGRLLIERAGSSKAKVEDALGFLHAAYKANPDDLSTGMAVSQILGSLGRTEEASRILATLVERAPDQRSINFAYAQALTKLGRGSESRRYLERTVAIDPAFAPAIMQLLDLYQQESEWLKSAEILAPLIAEEPMNLEMQRQQAYFYLRGGDARAARDRFQALVAADPKDNRSQFYLAEALNDLEQYAESEVIFRRLLETDASDPDIVTSFGLSLAGQKKWDEATSTFNRLLGMPRLPDHLGALARTQLAWIDVQKENYDAAVETVRPIFVFRGKPNNQGINIALEALRRQKKDAEALAILQPLATQFPDDPFINARTIELLLRTGGKDEARRLAAAQAKVGPRNVIAVSEAYVQAGDQPAAIAIITNAIQQRPDEVDLRFQLGALLERAGDRKAAEKAFMEILDRKADHAPSLNYLGYMWAENGVNLDRAEEMLTRAVGQEPNNGAYVDSLGWVYFRQGNFDLAEKYLTEAARLLPRDATVHEHLGDVLAKRGDMARALESYRTAVELDPESKDVEKLRSKIAEIERNAQTTH